MENFPLWGTLVNTGTVIVGSLIGLLIHFFSKKGKSKSPRFTEVSASIMRGLGLGVVMVGVGGAMKGVINDVVSDAVMQPDVLAEGLYSDNPRTNPDAVLIHRVEKIDESIISLANGAGSNRGTGGMATKLEAAKYVTDRGIDMYVTIGNKPERIYEILEGKEVGTHFFKQ